VETQRYEFQLSYQEFLAGIRLGRRRSPKAMLRFVLSWIWPAFLLLIEIAVLWDAKAQGSKWSDDGLVTLVLTLLLAASLVFRISRLRRSFRRSRFADPERVTALAFNHEYFVVGSTGRSEGRFLWPALYDFAENERVVLVYTSKSRYIVIPKRAMAEESWQIVRELTPNRKAQQHADEAHHRLS
jgi:hypothetical protein